MHTGQVGAAVLCGWEGNQCSGVALVMRHRLRGVPINGLNSIRQGDEHPTSAIIGI